MLNVCKKVIYAEINVNTKNYFNTSRKMSITIGETSNAGSIGHSFLKFLFFILTNSLRTVTRFFFLRIFRPIFNTVSLIELVLWFDFFLYIFSSHTVRLNCVFVNVSERESIFSFAVITCHHHLPPTHLHRPVRPTVIKDPGNLLHFPSSIISLEFFSFFFFRFSHSGIQYNNAGNGPTKSPHAMPV